MAELANMQETAITPAQLAALCVSIFFILVFSTISIFLCIRHRASGEAVAQRTASHLDQQQNQVQQQYQQHQQHRWQDQHYMQHQQHSRAHLQYDDRCSNCGSVAVTRSEKSLAKLKQAFCFRKPDIKKNEEKRTAVEEEKYTSRSVPCTRATSPLQVQIRPMTPCDTNTSTDIDYETNISIYNTDIHDINTHTNTNSTNNTEHDINTTNTNTNNTIYAQGATDEFQAAVHNLLGYQSDRLHRFYLVDDDYSCGYSQHHHYHQQQHQHQHQHHYDQRYDQEEPVEPFSAIDGRLEPLPAYEEVESQRRFSWLADESSYRPEKR